ncbi:hypothetical protein GIB67_024448 [Kingdonia uniflora]|uniref:Uncharacterized protein n=1 Tax=Kingdonia uniflora TaxID=39325 RepID=A0A7J7P4N7_9MAGN|nr:hypothetical protein GIB67_024448 [Kingdonia uniflora]
MLAFVTLSEMVKTRSMALKERIASKAQRLKLKYFGDRSLEMVIPAPVPPTYHGLSGVEAVEAEEDFYYKWRFYVFFLTGAERWACLRTLAKDRVRASYAGKGISAGQICTFSVSPWILRSSVNGASPSGRTNDSDSEGEGKFEQFPSFLGQLVSYPPGSDAFSEFCKAMGAIGGKWGVKSTVERKKSLLDEVVEEETELELILEELGLSRKKRVDSKLDKVRKAQSTRSMTGVDEGKKKISGDEAVLLSKGIWLGIEEEKSELKKAKSELEKGLAQAKTEVIKEVRLGRHLMLKGYSQEVVDAIKVDTYVEEGEDEKAEVVEVVDGLDGVSRQTVLHNQGDDVNSQKAIREMNLRINDLESKLARERETSKALLSAQAELQVELDSSHPCEDNVLVCNREFAEQFDRMKEVNENIKDQYVKVYFRFEKLNQAVSDLTLLVEEKDSEIKKELKDLSEATDRAKKLQR